MKVAILDTTGKNKGEFELPKELFGVEPNLDVLAQYIRVYQHRQRQATAKVQNRSAVTGTTAKVWRQKGTGRARHGSRKAPIFVKGGQAHAPTGEQNYTLRISKRLKTIALVSALSSRAKEIVILDGIDQVSNKTKEVAKMVKAVNNALKSENLTIVLDKPHQDLIQGSKNLNVLTLTQAKRLNAFEVIHAKQLVFAKESLAVLQEIFTGKNSKEKKS